jgi:hypothetical protein
MQWRTNWRQFFQFLNSILKALWKLLTRLYFNSRKKLPTYRGRSLFIVNIKKQARFIQIESMGSADIATLGFECTIYTGMTDGKQEVSQGKWVVMDLVELCFGSYRDCSQLCRINRTGCRTVQTRHDNNSHNVLQQMRGPMVISSALQKGRLP